MIHNMIWFILLFPLLGVLINGFFGYKLGRRAVGIVGAVVLAKREIGNHKSQFTNTE